MPILFVDALTEGTLFCCSNLCLDPRTMLIRRSAALMLHHEVVVMKQAF